MLPVYVEISDSDGAAAWLEREDGKRVPLKRILESAVDPTRVPPIHPTAALVEAARAALPDARTRETIALVSKVRATVDPIIEAVERLGPRARIQGSHTGTRALTPDELHELERVGLGFSPFPANA